jgi:hypothetical protein
MYNAATLVFVATKITGKKSYRFFSPEYKMVGAIFFHRLRDVLKADEQFTEATGSVKSGHCFCQRRRHQSFHHIILR